jgi:hypothetical protein
LVNILGDVERKGESMRGIWQALSDFESSGKSNMQVAVFQVRQIGNYVVMKSISSDIGSSYSLRGKISSENFITGTWFEVTKDERFYHGAFQLEILPTRNELRGKWIGFNRAHNVLSGSWIWTRESSNKKARHYRR